MKRAKLVLAMAAAVAVSGASASMLLTSCSATATPVSVRTFEQAGRVDVVCLKISDVDPATGLRFAVPPVPVPQSNCAPVAAGTDTSVLPYHLYALVTQTLRGEVAVVDLTASRVVDVSVTRPGINFIPVGANPTDIAVTPDGAMAFVASAEVNKPAIYGIPSGRVLGDSLLLTGVRAASDLSEWPVCALPQAPGRMAVIPGPGADGGASGSQLAVVLPGDASSPAKLVTVDIAPFLTQGKPDSIAPGSLAPCPITSAVELRGDVPASWTPGNAWPNGVPYVDGGIDLFQPIVVAAPPPPSDGGADAAGDAGTDAALPRGYDQLPVWAMSDAGADDASTALRPTPGSVPHARGLAFDGTFLYVADDALPLVHVIDTTGGKLTELAPLLATSIANPARVVGTTDVAVSPPTHDYKRYLYALDQNDGTIIVYDVSDPRSAVVRTPMQRPNPELNPFQAPDRIRFSAPVRSFAFVRHDVPLERTAEGLLTAAKSGLLCNPNRNVEPPGKAAEQGPFHDPTGKNEDLALGAYYRANVSQRLVLGPTRLRGIFAFVTLSNGTVVPVDVDDWDAACRRPVLLNDSARRSSLDISQRTPDALDIDPYAVPETNTPREGSTIATTTEEALFPVVAAHRPRSLYLLKSDATNGPRMPYVVGQAQLLESGAPLVLRAKGYPTLVGPLVKPDGKTEVPLLSEPNIRFSYEDPTVHFDQDWTLTYEGVIPGFDGIAGTLGTDDGYQTLSLGNSSGLFCRRGVEDLRQGKARVAAMATDNPAYLAPRIADRVADYVQITDEIVPDADPYWNLAPSECWDIPLPNDPTRNLRTETPAARRQVCVDKFGLAANQSTQRDFPVLEAYEDHLVLGRYLYSDTVTRPANGRIVQGRDASNTTDMKLAQCCFHNQAHFAVRGGSQWVAVGTAVGFLHHVTADPATHACVRSGVPREVLLNGRAVEFSAVDQDGKEILTGNVDRSSPYALRNPALSVALRASAPLLPNAFTNSVRDLQWKFTTRGSFTPLSINLASQTTAVVPRSMSYIDSIGRLAIVDGSSQGLILVDLDSVTIAGTPFF